MSNKQEIIQIADLMFKPKNQPNLGKHPIPTDPAIEQTVVRVFRVDPEGIAIQIRGLKRGQQLHYANQYLTFAEAEHLVRCLLRVTKGNTNTGISAEQIIKSSLND